MAENENQRPVDYDSFVLYRLESTGTFHRKATCANGNRRQKGITSPHLDGGQDIFTGLEVCRFGEENPGAHELCSNCCSQLIPLVKNDD